MSKEITGQITIKFKKGVEVPDPDLLRAFVFHALRNYTGYPDYGQAGTIEDAEVVF